MADKKTHDEFLKEIVSELSLTGDLERYDLSKVRYVNAQTKVILICREHGDWSVSPGHLRNHRRCPKCSDRVTAAKLSPGLEGYARKVEALYPGFYLWDRATYVSSRDKIELGCARHPEHGYFSVAAGK